MAADKLYIQIKVGDLISADPTSSMMDGMIIDYNDELEWKKEIIHPDFSKTAFAIMEVDRKYKPLIIDHLKMIGEYGTKDYRKRKGLFVLDDFKPLISTDIVDKWRSENLVPIMDMRGAELDKMIKLSQDYDEFSAVDNNAVSQGDYTVGSGGSYNYLTMAAADVDTTTMDGNISFTLQNAVTETAGANFAAASGGFKITIDSTVSPTDVLSGNIWTINHTVDGIRIAQAGSGTFEIKNLNAIRIQDSATFNGVFAFATAGCTGDIHDCWMKAGGGGSSIYGGGSSGAMNVFNCGIRDFDHGVRMSNGGHVFENILSEGNTTHGMNNGNNANTYRNVVCFNNGTDFSSMTSATGLYLAASDTTAFGTAPQDSLTPANEVELNDALATYGRPIDLATIYNSGVIPTLSASSIAGEAWASPYSIGILQLLAAGGHGQLLASRRNKLIY